MIYIFAGPSAQWRCEITSLLFYGLSYYSPQPPSRARTPQTSGVNDGNRLLDPSFFRFRFLPPFWPPFCLPNPSQIDPQIDKKSLKKWTWFLIQLFYHVSSISRPKCNQENTGKTIQERPGQKKWDFNLTRKNTYEKHFSHFAHHWHFQQKSKKSHSKNIRQSACGFLHFYLTNRPLIYQKTSTQMVQQRFDKRTQKHRQTYPKKDSKKTSKKVTLIDGSPFFHQPQLWSHFFIILGNSWASFGQVFVPLGSHLASIVEQFCSNFGAVPPMPLPSSPLSPFLAGQNPIVTFSTFRGRRQPAKPLNYYITIGSWWA